MVIGKFGNKGNNGDLAGSNGINVTFVTMLSVNW